MRFVATVQHRVSKNAIVTIRANYVTDTVLLRVVGITLNYVKLIELLQGTFLCRAIHAVAGAAAP